MENCLKGFFWVRFSGQSMLQFSKGGLTQNDLYDTICMSFIRFMTTLIHLKSLHTNLKR